MSSRNSFSFVSFIGLLVCFSSSLIRHNSFVSVDNVVFYSIFENLVRGSDSGSDVSAKYLTMKNSSSNAATISSPTGTASLPSQNLLGNEKDLWMVIDLISSTQISTNIPSIQSSRKGSLKECTRTSKNPCKSSRNLKES